jgi:hypothetical protein
MLVLLALNVPLMIIFFGLWVGVPIWLVLRRPDNRVLRDRAGEAVTPPQIRELIHS